MAFHQEGHLKQQQRKAATSFLQFIDLLSTEPPPAKHHRYLIQKLQDVADGKCKRLMVFMPPGSAKSYYANVMFSAWYAGAHPGKKLITASYSSTVAEKWGRRVRNIVREDAYQDIFRVGLKDDSQAAGRWELANGSEYYAAGLLAGITSYRADLGIIDDPVAGAEEAHSETIREKTKECYKLDFWSRLKPDAAVILIMTRWHEDDLAGWLEEEMRKGGEQWEIVSFPMLAEAGDLLGRKIGEPLWPEWFTPAMIAEAKRDERRWSSLYQQNPTPPEGNWFKREWLRYYDIKPAHLHCYGASDYAVTADGGDYTVHGVCGVDPDGNIYILDWWRGQVDTLAWANIMMDMIKQHKPLEWADEGGPIGRGVSPFIERLMRDRGVYVYRPQYPAARNESKQIRSNSIRGRMIQGKVYFPQGKPWLPDLLSELLTFPAGKHDDQVDTLALMGTMLDRMQDAAPPKVVEVVDYSQARTEYDFKQLMKMGNRA